MRYYEFQFMGRSIEVWQQKPLSGPAWILTQKEWTGSENRKEAYLCQHIHMLQNLRRFCTPPSSGDQWHMLHLFWLASLKCESWPTFLHSLLLTKCFSLCKPQSLFQGSHFPYQTLSLLFSHLVSIKEEDIKTFLDTVTFQLLPFMVSHVPVCNQQFSGNLPERCFWRRCAQMVTRLCDVGFLGGRMPVTLKRSPRLSWKVKLQRLPGL